MSERTEEINVTTNLPPSPMQLPEDLSPVRDATQQTIVQGELKPIAPRPSTEEVRARKAFLVTALERGIINDRMCVPLPADLHGEWVRRDQFEIEQMKRLGFRIDTEYATQRSLNSDGTGAAMVADVVFMVTERWNKEVIDEVKHEKFLEMHSPKRASKNKEEKDFASGVSAETGGVIPTEVASKTREARRDDISSALAAMEAQTSPQR